MSETNVLNFEVRGFHYVPAFCGDEGLVLPFLEGASQSFLANDPVKLSSGSVIAVTPAGGSQVMVGFALRPATGVTGAIIPVRIPRKSDLFVGRFESDNTFAVTNINPATAYDIKKEGTSWVIDQDTTTNGRCFIVGSAEWNPSGAAGGANNANPLLAKTSMKLAATAGGVVYLRFRESLLAFAVAES